MRDDCDIDAGRIAGMLARLRAHDFTASAEGELAIYDLIFALAAADRAPTTPEAMADHVTPLLASSREEQNAVHGIITKYLAQLDGTSPHPRIDWSAKEREARAWRLRAIAAGCCAVLLVAWSVNAVVEFISRTPIVDQRPSFQTPARTDGLPPISVPVGIGSKDPANVEVQVRYSVPPSYICRCKHAPPSVK